MMQRVCAIAILTALLGVVMSELGFKSRRLFGVLSALLILIAVSDNLFSVFSRLDKLATLGGISEASKCALKAVGTGYVFGFVGNLLSELGEGVLATAVGIACRVEMFLIVLPYFEKTVRLGIELLQ